MLTTKSRKDVHPLYKYMQHWQAFNQLMRKQVTHPLLRGLGYLILALIILGLLEYWF